ncbi:VP3 [California sea lion polyomavirus 1]|nr:VP3 [California sea lion polyomavirus 1]ADC34411.1 VP3 [California sea lion polyomavirus 1]
MALQVWVPDVDYLFPGVSTFARYAQYLDPTYWGPDLLNHVSRLFWQSLLSEGRRQIGHASRDLATTVGGTVQESLARFFENTRWAVSHVTGDWYAALHRYYGELPPLNPPQLSQLRKRIQRETGIDVAEEDKSHRPSANFVQKYSPPGGAGQRHAPDWLLPLLLGLYGDLTPTWKKEVEELEEIETEDEEDIPKKKQRSASLPGAKTPHKRRNRSVRRPNRRR